MQYTYHTIAGISNAEFKDRGSKFLAFAYPVENTEAVKETIRSLKEVHPKAVHHCYGFRIGTDNLVFRAADDGEPSGSAGKPILGQIDSAGLTNVLVVVVRYFGGTLLGVPGLINAYKTAAHDALAAALIIEKQVEKEVRIEFPYVLMNDVMRVIKQSNMRIVKQDMLLFCALQLSIPISEWETGIQKLRQLHQLQVIEP
jgi:uncharacterized YigZ family protein